MIAKNWSLPRKWATVILTLGIVLTVQTAQGAGLCHWVLVKAASFFPLNETINSATAREHLISSVVDQKSFQLVLKDDRELSSCHTCGTRDNHQFRTVIRGQTPDLEPWLGRLGFQYYRFERDVHPPFYQVSVPFGNKSLRMQVRVRYDTETKSSEPIYEYTESGGRAFYGNGLTTTTRTPVAIEVLFSTDGKWGLYFSPEYKLTNVPIPDAFHSFQSLNQRARLAMDLTRQRIRTFHDRGIERMDREWNDFKPPIDVGFVRGDLSLTNTEPTPIGLDQNGHFLVFIANLQWTVGLTENNYQKLRARTPQYKPIDLRSDEPTYYAPKPGEPYQQLP